MSIDTWFAVHSLESLWWAFGLFFIAALVEMVFPPFPGDAVYFLGLVTLAANGTSVYGSIIAACAGGTVGFVTVYWFGRIYGRKFFMKRQSGLRSQQTLIKVERWFTRWGGGVIIVGRFLSGIRAVIPLVAGVGSYPAARGIALGAASIIIWNGALAVVALELGQNWESISKLYRTYNYIFWLVAGVLILFGVVRWIQARRGQSGA